MRETDATHDTQLQSWVSSANEAGCDFPIQNLPFGRFSHGTDGAPRIGVAIGDRILDLRKAGLIDTDDMNVLMSFQPEKRSRLRSLISAGLAQGSERQPEWATALVAQAEVTMHLPCRIGDYTDFYTSVHHATTVGKQFRPENPLLPNYKWVPIGYHGRASSIGVGSRFQRPHGQIKAPDASVPSLGPSKRLDYELELGWFVAQGNALGKPVALDEADAQLFGVALFNDWSARDIQAWEYQPLGPFLSKNFASTISPWVITTEALVPFRVAFERPVEDPQPLPYLDAEANRLQGAFAIELEVLIQSARMREAGEPPMRLSRTSSDRAAYWTPAQLVAHHTVNGCNLNPGDLLGSGTLSGPDAAEAGSLMELTHGGKQPITLPNGERRTFLEDGDALIMRGWCERDNAVRIGLGEVVGIVEAR